MQQYLPFTVLKQANFSNFVVGTATVATVPTVYGIETFVDKHEYIERVKVVATVPTVYGIETHKLSIKETVPLQLQQYLPFTVLKLTGYWNNGVLDYSCNSTYRLRY